jgi:CBS domain-containing protein
MKSTVRDIMTTNVVTVHANASFKDIAMRLRENLVSAFPVLGDDGTVIGVVSEADLLLKEAFEEAAPGDGEPGILRGLAKEKARAGTAADLMSRPAVTVAPEDSVEHAARLMYARGVKRLPVTDAAGHLVGIVSRADVLSVFGRPDEEIRGQIVDELICGEFGADPGRFSVRVKDGVVTMTGRPGSVSLGRDLLTRARHVQGVVAVRDRFTYPVPERSLSSSERTVALPKTAHRSPPGQGARPGA